MSHNKFLQLLKEIIERHIDEIINARFIATQLGMNRMQLHRRLKSITGMSVSAYVVSIKMDKAEDLLINTQWKIKDIAQGIGYADSSYFSKVFKKEKKCLPREYRMKYSVYYQY